MARHGKYKYTGNEGTVNAIRGFLNSVRGHYKLLDDYYRLIPDEPEVGPSLGKDGKPETMKIVGNVGEEYYYQDKETSTGSNSSTKIFSYFGVNF